MKIPFSSLLLFFGFVAATTPLSLSAQDSNEVFTSANADFEGGNYEQAFLKYESLIDSGLISSTLYYNLGTTAFRLEEPGEAILWYRRARLVEPGAPEVSQNVEHLRTKLGFLEFADTGLGRFLSYLPSGTGRWLGSALLWGGGIAIAAGFSLPRLRKQRAGYLTLGIVLAMFGYVALRLNQYEQTQLAPENFATVTASATKALTAPAPSAKTVIDLPQGSEVRIIQSSGPWRYVDIPGELRGWVRAEQVEPVWPVTPTES